MTTISKQEHEALVKKHRGTIGPDGSVRFERDSDRQACQIEIEEILRAAKPYLNQRWDEIG